MTGADRIREAGDVDPADAGCTAGALARLAEGGPPAEAGAGLEAPAALARLVDLVSAIAAVLAALEGRIAALEAAAGGIERRLGTLEDVADGITGAWLRRG